MLNWLLGRKSAVVDPLVEKLHSLEAELARLTESVPWGGLPGIPFAGSLEAPWRDRDNWYYRNRNKRGDNPQAYLADEQLRRERERSRLLASRNEYARNALSVRQTYIIGTGLRTTAMPRSGMEDDAAATKAAQEAQSYLEVWAAFTKAYPKQKEGVFRYDRDGEVFFRLYEGPRFLETRLWEPEYIGDWDGKTTFGIRTDEDDITKIVAYLMKNGDETTNYEEVEADKVIHCKANVDSGIKRGLPFLYPIFNVLEKIESTDENMAAIIKIQAAIAMVRRHIVARSSAVSSGISSRADYTTTNPLTGGTEYLKAYRPGTILDVDNNTEYDFPANTVNVGGITEGKSSLLRTAAAGVGMPEYMFTSDAANGNFACHDSETELLTKRGWLRHTDLQPSDIAGTMNPNSGQFEWQPIEAIHSYDYSGEMVKLSGSHNLDVLVTPNHRMYVTQDQHRRIDGKLVRQGVKPWKFIRADELEGGEILPFACSPKSQGIPVECAEIEPVEHVSEKLADQVHSLAIQNGYVANLRSRTNGLKVVTLRPSKRKLRVESHQISRVNYVGKVWCATVENGLLVTRRNGKSIVTGNSTQVAESPAIANFLACQHYWGEVWGSGVYIDGADNGIMWRAIEYGIRKGELGEEVLELVTLKSEGPNIVVRDRNQETQRLQMLADAGIISRDEWAKAEGREKAAKTDEEIQAAKDAEMQKQMALKTAGKPPVRENWDEDLHPCSQHLFGE